MKTRYLKWYKKAVIKGGMSSGIREILGKQSKVLKDSCINRQPLLKKI